MKAKISRGGGFRGIAEYALGDEKEAEFVAGNVDGRTPRELSAEFALTRRLRPKTPRPVWHCSLSLPEGERLDSDKWETVVHDFLDGMLFDRENHQFFAVRHTDTDHDHVHIIVSRIGLDAGLWHGKWEARKAIDLTQKLEIQHGLTRTPGYRQKDEKSLTKGEIEQAVRTSEAPPKKVLQGLIKEAAEGQPTVVQFAEKLVMAGVEVRANLASTGRLNGFSFGLDGYSFKGSQLGKKFGWKALEKQGVSYEQERDREQLERFSGAKASQPADTDNLRIAVDVSHDQWPTEPVPESDRSAVEGVYIPADRPDSEQAQRASGSDWAAVVGDAGSGGDRHAQSGLSSDAAGERSGRGSPGQNDQASRDGIRSTDSGAGRTDQGGDRIDGHDQRPGSNGNPEVASVDPKGTGGHRGQGEQRGAERREGRGVQPEGQEAGQECQHTRPQHGQIDGSGHGPVGLGGLAGDLRNLASRHVVTPEKARRQIAQAIEDSPAPAAHDNMTAPTKLKRWYSGMKKKLKDAVKQAWDFFARKTEDSATIAGWQPDQLAEAGLEGPIVSEYKEEQRQAQIAEERRKQERKEAETKAQERQPDEPSGPDFDWDLDDDEPGGPGLR